MGKETGKGIWAGETAATEVGCWLLSLSPLSCLGPRPSPSPFLLRREKMSSRSVALALVLSWGSSSSLEVVRGVGGEGIGSQSAGSREGFHFA